MAVQKMLLLTRKSSLLLMGATAVMALTMLTFVHTLSRPSAKVLSQQKLWAWNMGCVPVVALR